VLAALIAAAGCSGSHAAPRPGGTPSAPTSTSPPSALAQLQQLAQKAAAASFTATYSAREVHPARTSTWHVWRTPNALRVDVDTGASRATAILTGDAAFACRSAKHHRARCFRVAGPGQTVPKPFQLDAAELFSADIATLVMSASSYDVTAASGDDGSLARPAATCFAIKPQPAAPSPQVPAATYCLSAAGVVASVRYPSGNSVLLTKLVTSTPPAKTFRPYASPTPVPS
jgi:hypothetical protein